MEPAGVGSYCIPLPASDSAMLDVLKFSSDLIELKTEFMALLIVQMGDISNVENEGLQTIHSCMSIFAKEAGMF